MLIMKCRLVDVGLPNLSFISYSTNSVTLLIISRMKFIILIIHMHIKKHKQNHSMYVVPMAALW